MLSPRLPSTQALQAFEAVARLRSVNLAAEELSVTPSAVSHRIRQLELLLELKFFTGGDFSLSADGMAYLARVREAIAALQQVPGREPASQVRRLRLAVTPTFSRQMLLPRLARFRDTYPNIELMLQVTAPMRNATPEEADLELRFGTGPFHDREFCQLLADEVSPAHSKAASPPMPRCRARNCCARRWSRGAPGSRPAASACPSPPPATSSPTWGWRSMRRPKTSAWCSCT